VLENIDAFLIMLLKSLSCEVALSAAKRAVPALKGKMYKGMQSQKIDKNHFPTHWTHLSDRSVRSRWCCWRLLGVHRRAVFCDHICAVLGIVICLSSKISSCSKLSLSGRRFRIHFLLQECCLSNQVVFPRINCAPSFENY
jgi:hypothetical protein